jgi:hypothetical protein
MSSDQVAELTARNQRLFETLSTARDMLLDLRADVDRAEHFGYRLRQRRFRLRSLRQQLI